ncbi:hypothetical protein R3X27_03520 [Tropicimonas sp. TH_r6]|uniref:hypothetical protein n=1 Tax=Tropicimonas sp. TH_r6 TaxID=3082085 RepID=UPI0029549FDA|nr:hypothetical protein [Tropicimonas sp. TH_r6]MDV7141747.1 hypothetical protein [Tropicimonas sp. TH_r6]
MQEQVASKTMLVGFGLGEGGGIPFRCTARARRIRPIVWALLWASLAQLTWTGFKLGQARLQPDAIATGLPGFLFRLVIRPLDWAAASLQANDTMLLSLQIAVSVTICGLFGLLWNGAQALGGGRGQLLAVMAETVPGRRETTWN